MGYFTELGPGLFNAWIGSLILFFTMTGIWLNRKLAKRLLDMSWHTPRDRRAALLSVAVMYGMMIFTVWVPLKTGTPWLYVGVFLFIGAYVCHMIALRDYAITPENQAITKGMYRISRNPLYFFYSVMFLGLVIASMSLPLFLIWIVYNVVNHYSILGEERYCLEAYPESYSSYMQTVPRYFLFF